MRTLALGSFLVLLSGCGSDPGAINIQWNIGLSGTCEDAGVVNVQITLTNDDGGTVGPVQAPCSSGADGFLIEDLDEGTYRIDLAGINEDNEVIYTGHATGTNVSEGKTANPSPIVMSPAPASLTVQWRFDNGLGCTVQVGAPEDVQVVLFKSNANEAQEEAACGDSQIIFGELEADDDYDVQVTAVSGSGEPLFRFSELDIQLADGEQRTVTGAFIPCEDIDGGCT